MRLLVLDHYFGQDLAELRNASGDTQWRVIDYGWARNEALRALPARVAGPLSAFADPALAERRDRAARRFSRLLDEQFALWPFDAFVSPSDTFFYVRSADRAAHALGVPFVVIQKETVISPFTMREDAADVRAHAPPIGDVMTACSERNREFWIRCGADPDRVVVTGQPRFDYYAQVPPLARSERPTVLFLSYLYDAYHPQYGKGTTVWERLHLETEDALWELGRRGWRVVFKPHPQQDFAAEGRRVRAAAAAAGATAEIVSGDADTRRLIADATVVVGFQTTALLEALAANRPAVYTGWDDEAMANRDQMIPFHEWRDAISYVDRAEDLVATVQAALAAPAPAADAEVHALIQEHLGPIDGHATQRVLEVVAKCAERFARERPADVTAHRAQVRRRKPMPASLRRVRDGIRAQHAAWRLRHNAG